MSCRHGTEKQSDQSDNTRLDNAVILKIKTRDVNEVYDFGFINRSRSKMGVSWTKSIVAIKATLSARVPARAFPPDSRRCGRSDVRSCACQPPDQMARDNFRRSTPCKTNFSGGRSP